MMLAKLNGMSATTLTAAVVKAADQQRRQGDPACTSSSRMSTQQQHRDHDHGGESTPAAGRPMIARPSATVPAAGPPASGLDGVDQVAEVGPGLRAPLRGKSANTSTRAPCRPRRRSGAVSSSGRSSRVDAARGQRVEDRLRAAAGAPPKMIVLRGRPRPAAVPPSRDDAGVQAVPAPSRRRSAARTTGVVVALAAMRSSASRCPAPRRSSSMVYLQGRASGRAPRRSPPPLSSTGAVSDSPRISLESRRGLRLGILGQESLDAVLTWWMPSGMRLDAGGDTRRGLASGPA